MSKSAVTVLFVSSLLLDPGSVVRTTVVELNGNAYGHCKDKAIGQANGHVCVPPGPTCQEICASANDDCVMSAAGDTDLLTICTSTFASCNAACP